MSGNLFLSDGGKQPWRDRGGVRWVGSRNRLRDYQKESGGEDLMKVGVGGSQSPI